MNNNEYIINLLKKEKNENLTDRNIGKTNLIKKNIFTGSFNNIEPKESKSSFIKKIPKIKLNLNFINNKLLSKTTENTLRIKNKKYIKIDTSKSINSIDSNKSKSKINVMNNTKPMYHRINIVNNKIIIINNNSKSKNNLMKQITSKDLKNVKSKKKNNLTLLTRNYINNNNYFGEFYGNEYDMINSQDKIIKVKNFNTSTSIKTYNQERKPSFKAYNISLQKNIIILYIYEIK